MCGCSCLALKTELCLNPAASLQVDPGADDLAALIAQLGLGGEVVLGPPEEGLHPGPGAPCALMLRSMLGLALAAMEGGMLSPGPRRAALERRAAELQVRLSPMAQEQHQRGSQGRRPRTSSKAAKPLQQQLAEVEAAAARLGTVGRTRRPALGVRVAAGFGALLARMEATPHAELRTAAATQSEAIEQLWECGAFEGRDWVLVAPGSGALAPEEPCAGAAAAAALLAPDAAGAGLPLLGGRCIVSASNGQQVLDAQSTDLWRVAALGRARLALLQRIMEQHAAALRAAGRQPLWDPSNPAHQALYW